MWGTVGPAGLPDHLPTVIDAVSKVYTPPRQSAAVLHAIGAVPQKWMKVLGCRQIANDLPAAIDGVSLASQHAESAADVLHAMDAIPQKCAQEPVWGSWRPAHHLPTVIDALSYTRAEVLEGPYGIGVVPQKRMLGAVDRVCVAHHLPICVNPLWLAVLPRRTHFSEREADRLGARLHDRRNEGGH